MYEGKAAGGDDDDDDDEVVLVSYSHNGPVLQQRPGQRHDHPA